MARASSAFCSTMTMATPSPLTATTLSSCRSAGLAARLPQPNAAAVWSQQPGHHLEQRRLAGAVGADDADDLPGVHGEVDALEDLVARRIAGDDALDGEQRAHAVAARRPRYAACTRSSAATCANVPSARWRPSAITITGSHSRAITSR